MSGRNRTGFRKNEVESRRGTYSRDEDCWNCGLPHHKSRDCTANKILRCSFCRKRGVRSDECHCRRDRRAEDRSNKSDRFRDEPPKANLIEHDKFEVCVLLSICRKMVIAVVSPSEQESRMGRKVFAWVKDNIRANLRKKIIKTKTGLELVQTVTVDVGVKRSQNFDVEWVIDHKLPGNEVTLGIRAMVKMGYQIQVAGQRTTQRRIIQKPIQGKKQKNNVNNKEDYSSDDDRMSFLDEEEEERIREWKY